mmetsp:Transcript_20545/g.54815  ORF Transcript_20545/g.54815 Transcript_20545/m.54815 type:complete len:115 (-) Transcript_20545:420-764(-)
MASEEENHPGIFACRAALLRPSGNADNVLEALRKEIGNQRDKIMQLKSFEKLRDVELETLDACDEARAEQISEKAELDILSVGHRLTDESYFDALLRLGEAQEALSDWKGALEG